MISKMISMRWKMKNIFCMGGGFFFDNVSSGLILQRLIIITFLGVKTLSLQSQVLQHYA